MRIDIAIEMYSRLSRHNVHIPSNPLNIFLGQAGKMLHNQSMNEDVTTTDATEEQPVNAVIKETGVVKRSVVVSPQECA